MPLMDEFREEREQIKKAPFPQKVQYFKDYYLLPTIFIVFVSVVMILLLRSTIFRHPESLSVTMINFMAEDSAEENVKKAFEKQALKSKKDYIAIDSNTYIAADTEESELIKYGYEDEQKLLSLVMSGSLDFVVSGQDVIERYIAQDWFDDLRTILDPDLVKSLDGEGKLLYAGNVPIAVCVDDSSLLTSNYTYKGKEGVSLYAAFPANSQRRELAAEFLLFLMGK